MNAHASTVNSPSGPTAGPEYPRPAYAGYANSTWMVLLFKERHAWSDAQTGLVLGLITAIGGALGAVGGGRLADAWQKRGRTDANLRVALFGAALMALAGACYPLATSGAWAATWLLPLVVGFSAPFGVVAAAIQTLAPAPMRAQASALFLFVINLLGLGLGPAATGWLADAFSNGGGNQRLHLALLMALVAGCLGALTIFGLGLKPYRRTCLRLATEQSGLLQAPTGNP